MTASQSTAKIRNFTTGKCLLTLGGQKEFVNSAAFSPNGALVVPALNNSAAKIWNATALSA